MHTNVTAQQAPRPARGICKGICQPNLALTLPPVDFLAVCFVRAMFANFLFNSQRNTDLLARLLAARRVLRSRHRIYPRHLPSAFTLSTRLLSITDLILLKSRRRPSVQILHYGCPQYVLFSFAPTGLDNSQVRAFFLHPRLLVGDSGWGATSVAVSFWRFVVVPKLKIRNACGDLGVSTQLILALSSLQRNRCHRANRHGLMQILPRSTCLLKLAYSTWYLSLYRPRAPVSRLTPTLAPLLQCELYIDQLSHAVFRLLLVRYDIHSWGMPCAWLPPSTAYLADLAQSLT